MEMINNMDDITIKTSIVNLFTLNQRIFDLMFIYINITLNKTEQILKNI